VTGSPRSRDVLFLDPDDAERLGRRVRAWMVLHEVSLDDLAAELRCSRWHLSRVLHNRVAVGLALALDLCGLTGLDIDGDDVRGPDRAGSRR
jgi:hypothetical protein